MEKKNTNIKLNKDLKDFLKSHVLKGFKILSVIGIILMTVILVAFSSVDSETIKEMGIGASNISLIAALKDRCIVLLLILLAGWVPYFYIPAISYVAYIFMLSGDFFAIMCEKGKLVSLLLGTLPMVIDVLSVSVVAVIGIYMCKYTGKKYKYAQRTSFSWLDIKIQFYEMTKQTEKYEAALKKKQEKAEKMKENDVKIDYKNIAKVAGVMCVINIVMCIIEFYIR